MNLKKSGGKGFTENDSIILKATKDQIEFIQKEIEIIEPDIIILSTSQNKAIRNLLFPDTINDWKKSGYHIDIATSKNRRIIDFYHPSARNAAAASYSLLQNVYRLEAFQPL